MEAPRARKHLYEYHRDNMTSAHCHATVNDHCLPHFHSSIELMYVKTGALHALLDGQNMDVPAGHILIVSSYVVHTYQSPQANEDTLIIVPLSVVPALQKTLLDHAFAAPVYDLRADAKLRAVLALLEDGWADYNPETRMGLCYTLLGMLIARVGLIAVSANARQGLMRDVLIYLQNNYQAPVSMDTLAQRFGYSKSRFSHLFNKTLGCPLSAFVNSLRCQYAARELLESDRALLEIALAAGFECPRTFYRAFKQYYGVTPTQYVRAHTGK